MVSQSKATFLDLMAVAVALMEADKLLADSEAWSRAWQLALQDPAIQELFSDVVFELREPYPPLSNQVEVLRRSLSRAGILSLHNPRYRYYTIEAKDKVLIQSSNREVLEEHDHHLREVARILDAELTAR